MSVVKWPAAWIATLASTLFGIVVGAVSDVLLQGSPAENFSAGLAGAAVGLLLSDVLERSRVSMASSLVEDLRQDVHLQSLVDDARTAQRFVTQLSTGSLRDLFLERYRELCTD